MDVVAWLLEEQNPSARYLALRHVLGQAEDDPQVAAARATIPACPPARTLLEAQWPAGYWMHPGAGYSPRHKATIWQVIFLSALGAPRTAAIDRACAYLLAHSRLPDGRFTASDADRSALANRAGAGTSARPHVARGTFLCLNGSLVRALLQLGYTDPRREESLEALADMILHTGPNCQACDSMASESTAWPDRGTGPRCVSGTVKALRAFFQVPEGQRSPRVQAAISAGITFLAGDEGAAERESPLLASTQRRVTASGLQAYRFGFPPDERADLLEALEVLACAGAGPSPGVEEALAAVRRRQGADGRWQLDYAPENTWADFGQVGQPSKWVTICALQALKLWSGFSP